VSPSRRLTAEGIGSVLLAATVIGSGVMAERLAGGNTAIALLANTGATVAPTLSPASARSTSGPSLPPSSWARCLLSASHARYSHWSPCALGR